MKRQIVLENGQLVKMVNESARRVLQGLVNEGFLGSALANTANVLKIASMLPMMPSIMNGVEKLVGGNDNSSLQGNAPSQGGSSSQGNSTSNYGQSDSVSKQISAEDLLKLYNSNPEAFKTLAQDPTLLSQITSNPQIADQIMSDPTMMQMLLASNN